MITIHRVALATPATMDADAYREFCWGAGLEHTDTGYGLLWSSTTPVTSSPRSSTMWSTYGL